MSTVRIDFHPAATAELEASLDWYAQRSVAASREFALAVDASISKILAEPARFLKIDARHRACSVERFPFQIVFRHDHDRLYVVAVVHAKRRPGYWRTRE